MKKQDLKTGMIIETRSGQRGLVVLDNCYGRDAVVFSDVDWTEFDKYNDDLIWNAEARKIDFSAEIDIMKVYKPNLPSGFLSRKSKKYDYNCFRPSTEHYTEMELLWERKEIPEYTMEEIIKKVGFEFKIKK